MPPSARDMAWRFMLLKVVRPVRREVVPVHGWPTRHRVPPLHLPGPSDPRSIWSNAKVAFLMGWSHLLDQPDRSDELQRRRRLLCRNMPILRPCHRQPLCTTLLLLLLSWVLAADATVASPTLRRSWCARWVGKQLVLPPANEASPEPVAHSCRLPFQPNCSQRSAQLLPTGSASCVEPDPQASLQAWRSDPVLPCSCSVEVRCHEAAHHRREVGGVL